MYLFKYIFTPLPCHFIIKNYFFIQYCYGFTDFAAFYEMWKFQVVREILNL